MRQDDVQRRRKLDLNYSAAGARGKFLRVAAVVALVTGVPIGVIVSNVGLGQARRRNVRFARQAALYLTVTGLDVRAGALARALGRSRNRISRACRNAEDARDSAAVDHLLERLEKML